MKKVLSIIKTILNVVVTVFVVLFLLVVCLQRFSNNEIALFNYRMFTVATGSMVPKYEVGDVLISKEVAPEDIKIGDTISYLGSSGSFDGKVVTHEVVDIEKDVDGNLVFHTKGIANIIEDPVVYEDQIYGVVVYKAVLLSFIYGVVSSKYGLFVFVVIPILYIVGSELLSAMLEKEDKRRKEVKEKQVLVEKKSSKKKSNKKEEE